MELIEREIIDGKPYGGAWVAKSLVFNEEKVNARTESETFDMLRTFFPSDLELRKEQRIYRPPYYGMLIQNATFAIKGILWGRAFKVQHLFKKGVKRTKKAWINGKRKRVYLSVSRHRVSLN